MRSFLVVIILVAFLLCSQTSRAAQLTTTWPLGQPNLTAAEGNPMKGLMPSPQWTAPPYLQSVPSSLEYHSLLLNQLMNASLSDFSGVDTNLEPLLAGSAARARHAVLRIVLDYPPQPTGVPYFLVADGLAFNAYSEYGGGQSPDYSSEALLQALEAFIAHLGARYDGDPRLAFIQVGLLGFWGEWHTYPYSSWLTAEAKNRVVAAFKAAFATTQLNVRVPWPTAISEPGFGLHDDSFAYSTVDGAANGGVSTPWFFWPSVVAAGGSDNWKHGAMGGEVLPGLQSTIFDSSTYPAGTEYNQDFQTCVETTHATYLLNNFAFSGAGYSGSALEAARNGSMRMGYNYVVPSVGAAHDAASPGFLDVTITLQNIGVAPFYYGLNVTLACNDNGATQEGWAGVLEGVENLLPGQSSDFNFTMVPDYATSCVVGLASKHVYEARPVRFAHNLHSFTLSLPTPTTTGAPTVTVTASLSPLRPTPVPPTPSPPAPLGMTTTTTTAAPSTTAMSTTPTAIPVTTTTTASPATTTGPVATTTTAAPATTTVAVINTTTASPANPPANLALAPTNAELAPGGGTSGIVVIVVLAVLLHVGIVIAYCVFKKPSKPDEI